MDARQWRGRGRGSESERGPRAGQGRGGRDDTRTVEELLEDINFQEGENGRLRRELKAKEAELKDITRQTNQTYEDQKMMTKEKQEKEEELRKLKAQNSECALELSKLRAEKNLKDKQHNQAVLSKKVNLERELAAGKKKKASTKEKELDRNLQEAKQKLEKKKAKSDALDKEHKDLQDLHVKLKRMVDFQIQLFDAVKELEEGVKDLGSQQEMKKREFKTFKEEMKDEMHQKNADLVELTEELRELQTPLPKKKGLFQRMSHVFFGCARNKQAMDNT
ncbi:hypothetical protein P5673_020494 [Acropora cervicornis]|uniref:Uncharacterized protein n=1 Tax=Acropora cervicornis TaxID=6130 RepID=A0AAD9QAP1_ACRCE|nr:hypothetical protein P5673_020494 [Acropora cervicornis]